MKELLTAVLMASLVWTADLSAQITAPGPLAHAMAREAVRIDQTGAESKDDQAWARVTKVRPGSQVSVVVAGVVHPGRYFLTATDREIVLLNTNLPQLPPTVRGTLFDLAWRSPIELAGAREQPVVDGEVSIGPDGIALNGHSLVGLSQVVERYDRDRVNEFRHDQGGKGTFSGDFGGFFVIAGVITGVVLGARFGHDHIKPIGGALGALGGGLVGVVAGGGTVALIERLDGSNVVYRASASAAPVATANKP